MLDRGLNMPRSPASSLPGFLLIDKPAGWTSHDVVAKVRRLTNVRRVGHAGTLDPFATGLLVVGIGKATRLIKYAQQSTKVYQATLMLGKETESLDPEGETTLVSDISAWPDVKSVEETLKQFVGTISQIPPAYSAIHIDGKRAYEFARAGTEVNMPERVVTINRIVVTKYEPPRLAVTVSCESGTYIRSLARDIGRSLGTYAFCEALRRLEVGPFHVDNSIRVDIAGDDDFANRWPESAMPPDRVVENFDLVQLSGSQTTAWYHGQSLSGFARTTIGYSPAIVRVYSADGSFAGLGNVDCAGDLRPSLVFSTD